MPLKRHGAEHAGAGGKSLPFAGAVEADGRLYVSDQVAMEDGEVVEGGIAVRSHEAIADLPAILDEAGYGPQDVVRVGVWLDDPRDFWSFNAIVRSCFGAHPPTRGCVQASMMVDCKVAIDCLTCKDPA